MDYRSLLQRVYALGSRGIDLGLDRMRAAADALGAPERRLRCAQIAGTNGKGAVAVLVEGGARESGLSTGLFTSPHLHRYTERFRVNGAEVDEAALAPHLARALALTEPPSTLPLTFFEVTTLAAFDLFAERGVDLAVLEVGLGGRLDATSAAAPEVTAIVSIGLDHTELLGPTLRHVAREKAGIARPGVPLVVGPLVEDARVEIELVAASVGAPLELYGRDFSWDEDLEVPWPGRHQRENAAVARAVSDVLGRIDPRLQRSAFTRAAATALWPGRYEEIPGRLRHVLDGAHNAEATAALVAALAERGQRVDAILFGACGDKPIRAMLDLLGPLGCPIVLAPPPLRRAFDPAAYAARSGASTAPDIASGLSRCRELAPAGGAVLVTGSLFTVAEARRILLGVRADEPIGL
jgi:dihydrofolate synthase / folylpolyglutamate synthase